MKRLGADLPWNFGESRENPIEPEAGEKSAQNPRFRFTSIESSNVPHQELCRKDGLTNRYTERAPFEGADDLQ